MQAAQPAQQQQQKVTYTAATQLQPGIKTQFFPASITQAQKPTGTQLQVRNRWPPFLQNERLQMSFASLCPSEENFMFTSLIRLLSSNK